MAAMTPTAIAGVGRGPERRVDWPQSAAERHPSIAAHREHQARGRALDRRGADEDGDEDHVEVEVAERVPPTRSGSLIAVAIGKPKPGP